MSIEGGRMSPAISSAQRGLNGLGVQLKAPLSQPIIEGPVPASFLRNTIPLTPNFQPAINAAEVIAEVETILAGNKPTPNEVPAIFEASLTDINLDPTKPSVIPTHPAHALLPIYPNKVEKVEINHIAVPKTAIERVVKPQIIAEPKIHPEPTATIDYAPIPLTHTHPAEAIKHKEETKGEEKEGEIGFQEQEHIETIIKPALVEDKEKMVKREFELDSAIEEVAVEAENEIEGEKVVSKVPAQHPGVRSQTLNEEDPLNTVLDGSYEKVKKEIKGRKFKSRAEAKSVAFAINKKYRAEKWGELKDITSEEHIIVHELHGHEGRIEDFPEFAAVFK